VTGLYVAAVVIQSLLDSAQRLGVARSELLSVAGLKEADVEDPEVLLDEDSERAIWRELVRRGGDTSVGIWSAQHLERGSFELLEYLVRTSVSLGEGLREVPRYQRLLRSYVSASLQEELHGVRLTIHREYDIREPGDIASVEASVAAMVLVGRSASGIDFVPAEIEFRHSKSSQDAAYAVLGPEVRFDRQETSMLIDRATLAGPMLEADQKLHELLTRTAARHLDELPEALPKTSEVRNVILELLPRGEPALERVAARLETSGRALQRQLKEEGTTFRAIIERVREQVAKRYLADTHLTATDVAMLLDYSDAASFHRAFKRWTGMAPGEYRRSLAP
jgi:AraC-like DNA-binding protein